MVRCVKIVSRIAWSHPLASVQPTVVSRGRQALEAAAVLADINRLDEFVTVTAHMATVATRPATETLRVVGELIHDALADETRPERTWLRRRTRPTRSRLIGLLAFRLGPIAFFGLVIEPAVTTERARPRRKQAAQASSPG